MTDLITCPHTNFRGNVEVNRLLDKEHGKVTRFAADVKINCADCELPFKWQGLEAGISTRKPMVSFDGLELRAPINPITMKGNL